MFTITHLSCDNRAVLITLRCKIFVFAHLVFYQHSTGAFVPLSPVLSCTELGIGLLPMWAWRTEVCPIATEALYGHTITFNSVDLVTWSVSSTRWQKILMDFLEGRLWKPSPALIWCQHTWNCSGSDTSFLSRKNILYWLANVAGELIKCH